uniref:Sleeping Beauty transposase HTH domain-containing protein n=1 Tax=Oncorhynchus tshawytscha TaxID=74940 RepID=A0AAZ3S5U5_ONCTS
MISRPISRPSFKFSASLLDIMGKSKEISQDLRKTIVDLHKSGSSLGAISKCLKVPHSSVQTIVRKYKHNGTTQPSHLAGRKSLLSPRDECALVQKVQINPRTTKDFMKMLEETGTKVSISTVK